MPEPYRSLFEWLLDVAVDVIEQVQHNRMDIKNMSVVLCPNLYESDDMQSPSALILSQSLLHFTEYCIKSRIDYHKTHPYRPADDTPHVMLGITPGVEMTPELKQKIEKIKSKKKQSKING